MQWSDYLNRFYQILFVVPPISALVAFIVSGLAVVGNTRIWTIKQRGFLYLLRSAILGVQTLVLGYLSIIGIIRFSDVLKIENLFWASLLVGLWVGCLFAMFHTSTQRPSPQNYQDTRADEFEPMKFFDLAPFIQTPLYVLGSGVLFYALGWFAFYVSNVLSR